MFINMKRHFGPLVPPLKAAAVPKQAVSSTASASTFTEQTNMPLPVFTRAANFEVPVEHIEPTLHC